MSKKTYLGVDIGSSSIKIVELKKEKGKIRLVTYGFTENNDEAEKREWTNEIEYTAMVIKKIMKEAGMKSINAVSALPSFSVFSSIVNLSNITKKEVESAVHWEAKKVIPLPLEDIVLDWKIITEEKNKKSNKNNKEDKNDLKILLTGAPKALVKKYVDIFKEARMNLLSLETETFSLIRSLIGNDKSTIMIVEIGTITTDITIVDNGVPILNRSIDLGGATITKTISKNLNIGASRAEQFKYDLGIDSLESANNVVPKTIIDSINPILNEIKYMLNLVSGKNENNIEKIILSGGSALLPNLDNYLAKELDLNVVIGDPWARVSYPLDLKPVLDELGPRFAVAIGLAIREIE